MKDVAKALVVDGLADGRRIVGDRLTSAGFVVSFAEDGLEALEAFVRETPDVVVTDWQMPRLDGLGLVRRIRQISSVPIVMISAFGSIPDCEAAFRAGADRYLQFRRDVARVGEAARELVCESEGRREGARPFVVGMTASRARERAREELREELERLLIVCRGNIAEMARRMERDRSTVRYHLRRFGMLERERVGSPEAPTLSGPIQVKGD